MYSWGSDTSAGWSGGGGYDYGSARAGGGRTYGGGSPSGGGSSSSTAGGSRIYTGGSVCASSVISRGIPVLGRKLATESDSPLVLAVDVTGSMAEWPRLIFEKLPLLYTEVQRYLPNAEISFAAIGDATCDRVPLQAGDFNKGKELDAIVSSLYPEGGGGGGARESYELMAYYYLNNAEIPKAKKPIFIFAGDEGFYDSIDSGLVKTYIGNDVAGSLSSMDVMAQLCKKYDTYILRKQYESSHESYINEQWKNALGSQKVMKLDDPKRIVDCIIGIVASTAGSFDDYKNRLTKRQTMAQVKDVMKTLAKLKDGDAGGTKGKTVHLLPSGKKSKGL